MFKKLLAVLLVAVMVFSLAACKTDDGKDKTPSPSPSPSDVPTEEPDNKPTEPTGQLTIGNTTELTGDWVPYWQNNAADYDIHNFVNGYGTVDMTKDGQYLVNETVVDNHEIVENEDGSKTYIWTIKQDLTYKDDTPITAKDYVANVLFWSSSQIKALGARNTYGYSFVGYDEFSTGEAKEFTGVRLLDDYKFSVTVKAEELPYYFELPMFSVGPFNLAYWTDENVEIKDDGNGAYFSDNFTAENYKDKIEAARFGTSGYPSSGPYYIESYDASTKVAVLKVNDKYKGNYEGQKPLIETLIYKSVTSQTALDELETGQVDLLTGMGGGDEINAGHDLVGKGGFSYSSYPRSGYGKLNIVCDFGPTQFIEVRHALAHLLDRNDFARTFTGGYGSVVNGPYGEAMWFYQETKAELNEKLNQYSYSLEDAIKVLEEGGWTLNSEGGEYTEGIRYKEVDGELMPLILNWGSSENNPVSELLVVKLQNNPDVAAAGMKIEQTILTWDELLNYLYRDASKGDKYGVPTFHLFNLASGFDPVYDRQFEYTLDEELIALGYNSNFIRDQELYDLAKNMVLTNDDDEFKQNFVDFIARWNYLLPDIPLYSNIYHDFYNDKLKDWEPNDLMELADIVLYAYVEE